MFLTENTACPAFDAGGDTERRWRRLKSASLVSAFFASVLSVLSVRKNYPKKNRRAANND
jgi:hypothetical protein